MSNPWMPDMSSKALSFQKDTEREQRIRQPGNACKGIILYKHVLETSFVPKRMQMMT